MIVESEPAGQGVYSTLMPPFHAEMLMRIYTKKVEYYSLIQAGYHACIGNQTAVPPMRREEEESMAPTPPVTEAPTTPRARASPSFNSSLSAGGGGTPVLPNPFMTVSADYMPKSPLRRPAVARMWTSGDGGSCGRMSPIRIDRIDPTINISAVASASMEVVGLGAAADPTLGSGASATVVVGASASQAEVLDGEPKADAAGDGVKVGAGMKRLREGNGHVYDPSGNGDGDGESEIGQSGNGGKKRKKSHRKRSRREGGG